MKIFLLSSAYPSNYSPKGTTPVVHYFAKEWAKAGHQVYVFHINSIFPQLYYYVGKLFKKHLDSLLGHLVPDQIPIEYNEVKDGVRINHINLRKIVPHGKFSTKEINKVVNIITTQIEKEGIPDCFVGHWDNPQLELLHCLKEKYHRPTCLVYHSNKFGRLEKCYGIEFEELRNDIDLVGFRNKTSLNTYINKYGKPRHSFVAFSGIPHSFVEIGNSFEKKIGNVRNYVYVGALVARKFPLVNINALAKSYKQEPFSITFIGDGVQKKDLEKRFRDLNCKGQIKLTGRIPRDEVISHLKEADVFIMISKAELFGLVYLEAMAMGCITIGSRNEGIDGIIEDGVNGFLCQAGDEDELCSIIDKIRSMPSSQLMQISNKARQTAFYYTDVKVAERYVEKLKSICAL